MTYSCDMARAGDTDLLKFQGSGAWLLPVKASGLISGEPEEERSLQKLIGSPQAHQGKGCLSIGWEPGMSHV
jgi:hypothetical protein